MRIQRIKVEELFGIFNHDIGMKMDERITIIHGANGYGKTTILRMVYALFHKRYSELRNTLFTEFRVDLEDGTSVSVSKSANGGSRQPALVKDKKKRHRGLIVKLLRNGKEVEKAEIPHPNLEEWEGTAGFPINAVEQFVPGLVRESRTTWRYMPSSEELYLEDIIDRFGEHFPIPFPHRGERKDCEWLNEIQKSVQVRLIETQRLLKVSRMQKRGPHYAGEASPALEPSVATHASDLAKAIQGKLAEYAALSQSLDRTFPVRLVEQMQTGPFHSNQTPQVAVLRQKLTELEEKRKRLQAAGLLDKQEGLGFQVPEEIQESTQRMLPVYVEDVGKKLSVFDGIAAKIDLLKKIVNSRFTFKKMSIDKERGFVFATDEGHPLTPTHLSSGEQHMLVLFSELLFRVEPDSLVMIDEPEISLHVTWQQQFLRDLQGVTELASFDVLIATHSPQIVNDRWEDLTVELESPVSEEQPV
jgi:ABC-type lipoprotein export system ATPase subunit